MSIRIIKATEKYIKSLLTMMEEFYLLEHLAYSEEILLQCIKEFVDQTRYGIIRIVIRNDEITGYFILTFGYSFEFHGRDALLDEFYIREEFRRKGLGTACLKYIEEYCTKENIKAVHLEVDKDNLEAKELYHRNGYADHNRYLLTKWLSK